MNKIFEISRKWWFWPVFCFVLYASTINHDYVIDDQIVVTNNKLTQEGISAIPEIFQHSYLYGYDGREDESYRPVTLSTFAIERSLFDANPAVSHFIQVLLYGLTLLLLFRFLSVFFEEKIQPKWLFLITCLFAIHPIHTEVVANVKSRDELLCALFLFASLFLFVKFLKQHLQEKGSKFIFALSIVMYFLAVLSKETAIPAIVLFPAISWYFGFKKTLVPSLVMLLPLGLYWFMRSAVLSDVLIQDEIDPVANSLALARSSSELLSSNFAIFSKYLQLLACPWNLSWDYSVAQLPIVSFGNFAAIVGVLAVVILFYLMVTGLLRKNVIGFGALIFISTFAATSNFFFLINCPLGERFMFIPVLGFILMVVFLLQELFVKIPNLSKISMYFGVGIAVFFTVRTVLRNSDWKNNLSIYQAGVEVSPNSVKTHFNLGTEYITQANLTTNGIEKLTFLNSALKSLKKAEEIYPKYVNIYENKSYALAELSKLETDSIKKKEYLVEAKETIETGLSDYLFTKPNLIQNQYYNLNELIKLEQDTALKNIYLKELYLTTILSRDYNQNDYHNAFYALRSLGEKNELVQLVEEKGTAFPDLISLASEQALTYFNQKDYSSAIRLLSVYLKVIPKDFGMKTNLGMMYELSGQKIKAIEVYESVLKEDPQNAKAQTLLGNLK